MPACSAKGCSLRTYTGPPFFYLLLSTVIQINLFVLIIRIMEIENLHYSIALMMGIVSLNYTDNRFLIIISLDLLIVYCYLLDQLNFQYYY